MSRSWSGQLGYRGGWSNEGASSSALSTSYSTGLDGTDENINLTTNTNLNFTHTDAFSLSFWAKFASGSGSGAALAKQLDDASTFRGYQLWLDNSSKFIYFTLRNDNSASNSIISQTGNATVTSGAWAHWAFTYDGSEDEGGCTAYKDGSAITLTNSNNGLTGTIANAAPLRVGANGVSAANFVIANYMFLSVHPSEISAGNVTSLYNSGSPIDPRTLGFWSAANDFFWPLGAPPDSATDSGGYVDYGDTGVDGSGENLEGADIEEDSP